MEPVDAPWTDRERRTARLVRACFKNFVGPGASAEKLHALCRLTWITKARGEVVDNTRSVVAPALGVLLGTDLAARTSRDLGQALRGRGAPDDVIRETTRPIGFVNFYTA